MTFLIKTYKYDMNAQGVIRADTGLFGVAQAAVCRAEHCVRRENIYTGHTHSIQNWHQTVYERSGQS